MRKLLFPASLLTILFVAIILNIYFLRNELNGFYLFVIKEETSRVKSVVEGTIAGGGDPVEALTSYMESSKLLKGATFKLEGREIIIPGSDISQEYFKESFKVQPFSFALYFDFSYVREFNKHLSYVLISLLFFSLLFTAVTVWLVREYFKERILYEREKQEKEKLESINLVIHSLIHEVKNRLNVLRLLVYRLGSSFDETYLQKLREEIDKLGKYVEETANLRKPLTLSKEKTDIFFLIKDVVSKFDELLKTKGIDVETKVEKAELELDPEKFSSLLIDLIKNGIEALEDSEKKALKILGKKEGNYYTFYIMDSGGKLPGAELFEPFRSTKEKGFGLGLYNAKRVAEAHGGEIEAFVRDGWTVFKVSIPIS
ncbi:integral membrane sensor signal transduction histidine kinase [Desulfurobacterium thermolithotrophum DSM 11699]|uniref:histidine kinase n=1 Tax=Desulfurobacterium thermolithotrophum (strain DSM 11699 / BSA) TaxID=868864 RepID=F0S3U4_DESTD|nr:HAMP domain-containing sensor histidine kinase [Desulfurobacterium thermolithotrophum]ADY73516.1 integral membrane sensor signal transduction histidine kinase [Desulfurobacterium thermolithotrophum DSM 11699]